jgi:hypothetical protein
VKRFLRGPGAPALIAAVALLCAWTTDELVEEATAHEPALPTDLQDAAVAQDLLGGLAVGDVIDPGWQVVEISGPREGRVVIGLEAEGARIDVSVVRTGTVDATALLSNGTFDLHFSVVPGSVDPPLDSVQVAFTAIARRIGDRHDIPPGL